MNRVLFESSFVVFFVMCLVHPSVSHADGAYEGFKSDPTPESAFAYIHQVATHPRCANCHGVIEGGVHRPTVGDYREAHPMNISASNNVRLKVGDHGFEQIPQAAMTCRSCHQDENHPMPGMPPGAANDKMPGFIWHMPPPTMAIPYDFSAGALCAQWLDPARNTGLVSRGGRHDLKTFRAEFLDHHASVDPLIAWSWSPGVGREPAPGTQSDFISALDIWIGAGAPCSES